MQDTFKVSKQALDCLRSCKGIIARPALIIISNNIITLLRGLMQFIGEQKNCAGEIQLRMLCIHRHRNNQLAVVQLPVCQSTRLTPEQ